MGARATGVVFTVVGALVVLASLVMLWRQWDFWEDTPQTYGVVTATPYGPFHPYVRFELSSGETFDFVQGGLVSRSVGEKVPIRYEIANPHHAAIDSFGAIYGFTIIGLGFGVVMMVVGVTRRA